MKGETKSGPLLSLKNSADLGLLRIKNKVSSKLVDADVGPDDDCKSVDEILEESKGRFEGKLCAKPN